MVSIRTRHRPQTKPPRRYRPYLSLYGVVVLVDCGWVMVTVTVCGGVVTVTGGVVRVLVTVLAGCETVRVSV